MEHSKERNQKFMDKAEHFKTKFEIKHEFIEWMKTRVENDSTINGYIKSLEEDFPTKLDISNLFEITDVEVLNTYYKRCAKGNDLYEWNRSNGAGRPQASLGNYLKFLKGDSSRIVKRTDSKRSISREVSMNIKNIILYGAPGVGKTHNYRNLISMIEEGKHQNEIFSQISDNKKIELDNDTFENIKKEKRVEFVTFHQSYSYEDFIEGFRPNKDGDITLEDGIFKLMSDHATDNLNKSYDSDKLVFNDAFNILLKDKIEKEESVKINLKRDNSFFEIYDFDDKTIYYTRQGRDRNEKYHTLSTVTLKQMYHDEKNNVIKGGLATYYNPLLEQLLQIGQENKVEETNKQNFYIVVDEINRGNISKIFGELITLIEEDKRDKYEVTLPYSKSTFSVPSNLYIIATMNSTDKSIATVDIALRRRFTFLKMAPNSDLVENAEAKELMNNLNRFIGETLGDDYKLGHSYFMTVSNTDDLDFVKEYKIKPLLEEYFYADEDNYKKAIAFLSAVTVND